MSSIGKVSKPLLGLACAFGVFLSDAVPAAQHAVDWTGAVNNGLTRERVVGLLDVLELNGPERDYEVPVSIKLYGTPSTEKPPIGVMDVQIGEPDGACVNRAVVFRRADGRSTECMPMEESGYEISAAVVYERTGQWFRIALQRGSAWMMSTNPQHFYKYPEMLLENHLTHMAAGWDGRLWSTPGGPSAKVLSPKLKSFLTRLEGYRKEGVSAGEVDVDVLAVRRVGGEMWIQVRVIDGHCEGEATTLDTGWVPAHGATRKPSVWFYSRGC